MNQRESRLSIQVDRKLDLLHVTLRDTGSAQLMIDSSGLLVFLLYMDEILF